MLTIDLPTAQRFILGRQGLWPGRRWRGLAGAEQAMRAMQYLQLDPLQIIARSQDISLYGRVLEYRPEGWEELTYRQRKFFDWGAWLAVRPMDELPHWRVIMRQEGQSDSRLRSIAKEHAAAIDEMRAALQARGQVSNRDFDMADRTRTNSYRGRKDSALALYYLWQTGEAMTHHRERFERVYAPAAAVAPAALLYESSQAEVDRFLIGKEIGFSGLSRLARTSDSYRRGQPDRAAQRALQAMLADGQALEVQVTGWKPRYYALASELPELEALSAGRIPAAWAPLETTTRQEAVFLAPLDEVIARGRAKLLFGFDYVWEVYKPEHMRKYGYYTLPVLWGDRLAARFDSKFERASGALLILGLWLEDPALAGDGDFAEALAAGFARFLAFLGARKLDARAVAEPTLRRRLQGLEGETPA